MEISAAVDSMSISTGDERPATTHISNVSASLSPRPGQYETVDDISATSPVLASLPPTQGQYETIQDLEPNHLTSGDHGSSGPYSYIPGRQVGNLRDTFTVPSPPATNYVNVDMSSLMGNPQNKSHQNGLSECRTEVTFIGNMEKLKLLLIFDKFYVR